MELLGKALQHSGEYNAFDTPGWNIVYMADAGGRYPNVPLQYAADEMVARIRAITSLGDTMPDDPNEYLDAVGDDDMPATPIAGAEPTTPLAGQEPSSSSTDIKPPILKGRRR